MLVDNGIDDNWLTKLVYDRLQQFALTDQVFTVTPIPVLLQAQRENLFVVYILTSN